MQHPKFQPTCSEICISSWHLEELLNYFFTTNQPTIDLKNICQKQISIREQSKRWEYEQTMFIDQIDDKYYELIPMFVLNHNLM